jgi:hypothetical protein
MKKLRSPAFVGDRLALDADAEDGETHKIYRPSISATPVIVEDPDGYQIAYPWFIFDDYKS